MTLADLIESMQDSTAHRKAASIVLDYVIEKVSPSCKHYDSVVFELKAGPKFRKGLENYAASDIHGVIRKELAKRGPNQKRISRKIRNLGIGLLIFQLATGIEAIEQIRFGNTGKIPGYNSLRNIAYTLSGRPKRTATHAGRYLVLLAEENSMPNLTKTNNEYIRNLTPDYVRDAGAARLRREIRTGKGFSAVPGTPTYSPLLDAVLRKAKKNRKLRHELTLKLGCDFKNYF